jgi:DNA adenine methylase
MKAQKTILRYAGGKSKGINKITPFVKDYDEIISPFLGGGSLEVHWASHGKKVVGSDIFDILINFWNVLLETPRQLASELEKIEPNKQVYSEVKEKLLCTPQVQKMLEDWNTDYYLREPYELSNLKSAAYYYFNHNCSYGPGFLGWASKIYMDKEKWEKTISKIRTFRCPNLKVAHMGFEEAILNSTDKFLYLDPPYYLNKASEDNKMFSGIYPMRNIPVHHDQFDHERLRDLLHSHEGDFVLSYNDCDYIRKAYSDFDFYYPKWHYSMSLGETRIGKNRKENGKKDSHEILIVKKS